MSDIIHDNMYNIEKMWILLAMKYIQQMPPP